MFPENKKLREFRSISELINSQEAKEIYKEPVVNRDTGERVFITPASFTHIFPDNARFKQNLARNIRAVLENAVLTHAEKATHGATNASGVYTLFAAVRTDEGVKPVKIKVKEYINEGARALKADCRILQTKRRRKYLFKYV